MHYYACGCSNIMSLRLGCRRIPRRRSSLLQDRDKHALERSSEEEEEEEEAQEEDDPRMCSASAQCYQGATRQSSAGFSIQR